MKGGALIGLALASFMGGLAGAPLQSLFPVYVEADLQRHPIFAAGLRVPLVLLGGIFAIAGGALCDRIGRRKTFLLGLTGSLAAGGVFLTPDPLLIALLCAYVGQMTGFLTTGGQSYLMAAAPRERMGMGSALYFLSGTLGIALGSRAGGAIAEAWSFAVLGQVMLLLAVPVVLVAALLLPEPPGSAPVGRRPSAAASYLRLLRLPRVRLLLWLRFLPTCYWGAATQVLALLIFRATNSTEAAATYAAASLAFAAVCQLLTGRWCDRAGPRRPVLFAAAAVAACAALTALGAGHLGSLFFFGLLGAGAAWSLSTTMPRLIHEVAPEGEQGTLVGAAHLAWSAGMLAGILGGGLLVAWRPGAPFAVTALLCAVAVAVAARLLALLDGPESDGTTRLQEADLAARTQAGPALTPRPPFPPARPHPPPGPRWVRPHPPGPRWARPHPPAPRWPRPHPPAPSPNPGRGGRGVRAGWREGGPGGMRAGWREGGGPGGDEGGLAGRGGRGVRAGCRRGQ